MTPYGLLLSGGKSTRMGKDKSLLVYHEGKPQRQYVFEMLSACCPKVYTACRPGQDIPLDLNPLVDRYDVNSPLNGILTAFAHHPDKAWLVLAVDMPNVTVATLQNLLSQRNRNRVATCFFNSRENAPEPLLSLWEPAAFPLLLKNVEAGNVSPRSFLHTHDVQYLTAADENIFLNVNYPHELPPGV